MPPLIGLTAVRWFLRLARTERGCTLCAHVGERFASDALLVGVPRYNIPRTDGAATWNDPFGVIRMLCSQVIAPRRKVLVDLMLDTLPELFDVTSPRLPRRADACSDAPQSRQGTWLPVP